MEFNELKEEILRRAREASACTAQYRRACQSEDLGSLMQVIKDNFDFAVSRKVIDAPLIEACKEQFNANQIYCNVDVEHGFLLASGNATVKASGNATVEAWDNSYVTSYCNLECKLSGNAIYRIRESNTVRYASDDIKFEKVPACAPEEAEKQAE